MATIVASALNVTWPDHKGLGHQKEFFASGGKT